MRLMTNWSDVEPCRGKNIRGEYWLVILLQQLSCYEMAGLVKKETVAHTPLLRGPDWCRRDQC